MNEFFWKLETTVIYFGYLMFLITGFSCLDTTCLPSGYVPIKMLALFIIGAISCIKLDEHMLPYHACLKNRKKK